MLAGEALHGNLAGYRKLKHKKLGLKIVFHETVNAIEIIEVIAIGKRSDNEIYTISEKHIKNKQDKKTGTTFTYKKNEISFKLKYNKNEKLLR